MEVNSKIISSLIQIADEFPERRALVSEGREVTYKDLVTNAYELADWLIQSKKKCVAVFVENSVEWVVIDLACIIAGVTHIALPDFFSNQQLKHVFQMARPDIIISDHVTRLLELGLKFISCRKVSGLNVLSLVPGDDSESRYMNTGKVTFTSGTTGQPKGVCLGQDLIDDVTMSLKERLQGLSIEQHICILPLSTLLENIAGIYVPLVLGSSVYVTPLKNIGFNGSSGLDLELFINKLKNVDPDSLILFPQLLSALVSYTSQTKQLPFKTKFIAVGGSKTPPLLIQTAREQGWPVYEGYGLSETGSVVSMNVPGLDKTGSVGKPLSRLNVEIINGEICLKGKHYSGYLGEAKVDDEYLHTGDLGHIDDEGYLHVDGRKKNLIITSYGRNISPEWIESELQLAPSIAQCMVYGDAQPFCSAIIVSSSADNEMNEIEEAIEDLNKTLPEYASIRSWVIADGPFTIGNGLLTANGRPKRLEIAFRYQRQLNAIYESRVVSGVSS